MGLLQIKDLKLKMDGNDILNGITLDIWKGYVHAIVGPNGAGKSTLAYTVMGLPDYRKHTGNIVFEGKDISEMGIDERARMGITLAWQEPARFEGLSLRKFLTAVAKDKSDENIRKSLEMVGLDPDRYLDRAVDKSLSGGERKRIELASIWVIEPALVLLDEPDSGIDVAALENIFDMIENLKAKGTTIIMITHSMTVLSKADHAFLMCNGRIMDKGEKDRISKYFETKCLPCDHPNLPEEDAQPDIKLETAEKA